MPSTTASTPPATPVVAPQAAQPLPFSTPKEHVFDLDADPAHFPCVARIYLCLLAQYFEANGPKSPFDGLSISSSTSADAPLVTPARLARGIEILHGRREAGEGIFFDSFTRDQLDARPLYPFLPPGLPADALDRMWGGPGVSFIFTNVILPIPLIDLSAAPAGLLHAAVWWVYSTMAPNKILSRQPRFAFDEDLFLDFDAPLDMDKEYPDVWTANTVGVELCHMIERYRDFAAMGKPRYTAIPWAVDRDALERVLPKTKPRVWELGDG